MDGARPARIVDRIKHVFGEAIRIPLWLLINLITLPFDIVRWFFTGIPYGFHWDYVWWRAVQRNRGWESRPGPSREIIDTLPPDAIVGMPYFAEDATAEDRARWQPLDLGRGPTFTPPPPPVVRVKHWFRRIVRRKPR